MLLILNQTLFHAQLTPVIPGDFQIEYDPEERQATLLHNGERVVYGVVWYGFGCQIDGKSGKITRLPSKSGRIRAIFCETHLDLEIRP